MSETLTPQQVSGILKKPLETLRRWRVAGKGPPFVMEGRKPRYRSDLIHAGTYAVQGRQDRFPVGNVITHDTTKLSGPEKAFLDSVLDKAKVEEWEPGSELVLFSDIPGADLRSPEVRAVLNEIAKALNQQGG